MLNKMSMLLATVTIALTAGAANADDFDRGHDHGNRSNVVIDLGAVAFGYNDGYWDNGHHWHKWRHRSDYRYYRDHGQNYHSWNHDRDNDNGWHQR